MSEDGVRSRRRNKDDGKPPASATKEEKDGDDAQVVEISSSSDWEEIDGISESDSGCETSDEDFVVEEEEEEEGGDDDVASLSERVSCLLLQEKRSVDGVNLKLVECKAYLRKHGLRVGGTKAVCLERINEHLRIKDGNGEKLYPISSFIINCTGDVCKGDVVLFTQKVHESFDKVTKDRRILGRRTIAGRVIKESYGSAKQQHTFTVEVLWSKGLKQLPPLFPLLVKGRNLYKMRTFRQTWEKEDERQKVLDEKHKRGSEARRIRAIRISKLDSGKRAWKTAKASKPRRQPQMNKAAEPEQRRPFHPRPCANGTSRLQISRNFHCRLNINPNLQSYAWDAYPQGYYGQESATASQPRMQPQENKAAEPEQRRPFLEHPRPCVNGTSGSETSRNFQNRKDINQNLQPYAQNGYPQLYHSSENFQGTTFAPMPRPHNHNQQYHVRPPQLPPPSYNHSYRHTNDVRYGRYNPENTSTPMPRPHNMQYNGGLPPSYSHSFRHPNDMRYRSFNPRNTRYIPEPATYQKRYPAEAYDHRAERNYAQYEHENRADRRGH